MVLSGWVISIAMSGVISNIFVNNWREKVHMAFIWAKTLTDCVQRH